MATDSYKIFNCFNRKFTITEPGPPSDVKQAFSDFTAGASSMSSDHLRRFLTEHQAEMDCTPSDSDRILKQWRKHDQDQKSSTVTADSPGLTLDEFFRFLFLDDFNHPLKSQVHHDMNAPLSHYFIYTGHNSYLTGNQLSSDSSDVPIIKALQRGVRVIELDLWPNSTKDDIVVVHGRTLTSPVSLIQCLKSIKEYAFVQSHYPVIITLEDHLTPDLQAKLAEMATQIFGELLYYPQTDSLTEFPTPESLKGRILISTKPPKEYLESKDNEKELDDEGSTTPDLTNELETDDRQSAPEYKRLITIHAGKPKGDVQDELKVVGDVRRLSLSEQALEKASDSYGDDIVRFTQKNILRVYPKGTRLNSSNYKPHIGWTYGAQMVALNMQGYGKSLWFMEGMFRANGGCGYVKKPEFLIQKGSHNEVFDPKRTLPVKKILTVKVYMGNGWSTDFSQTDFDTYSPPDFYAKVGIVGVPGDIGKKKTRVISNNWFPVWDEEFEFPLAVPELALLRIEVRDDDKHGKDDFCGQTCLPVSELKSGFRSVPLYDEKGEKLKSVKLLMRFQFR
ncbi:phosphoinositide phospholipase C 6-like isoform X1 [Gastrolobium bilobum]|uniref:phosphoinositide phospholipase C 6-like isoform X1 n=1 Tax=Gastrolobium bilobum TaxID=150636 RepID=UPI002AB1874C|nr:phosphoinositide phospholipase C 6-like isoform X1 [Gastrolobium bilobum]